MSGERTINSAAATDTAATAAAAAASDDDATMSLMMRRCSCGCNLQQASGSWILIHAADQAAAATNYDFTEVVPQLRPDLPIKD